MKRVGVRRVFVGGSPSPTLFGEGVVLTPCLMGYTEGFPSEVLPLLEYRLDPRTLLVQLKDNGVVFYRYDYIKG